MKLECSKEILQDAINIYHGVYYPLTGFLGKDDFQSVLDKKRLSTGEVWSLPIILDVNEESAKNLQGQDKIIISDGEREAVISEIEIFPFNKKEYAEKIYKTLDINHPGVAETMKMGDYLLGGKVLSVKENSKPFSDINLTPSETKEIFRNKDWKTVVAFQTRNVPHRSHEFLQREAQKRVDGLFIQPVIGKKKPGDFKDDVIIDSYKILIENHYSQDNAILGVLPIKMRYAGPREAIMHALIRRNYGCTHIIIGRDHAGVGKFYDPYEAQRIFDDFTPAEIGIEIIKFGNAHHCNACGQIIFEGECGHADGEKVNLSGTKIRELIKDKQILPEELIRREISELLLNHENPFVE